jgi:N-methylhydantoinase A/oxoprolinase/acetone carboxylase beta subunit
MRRGIDTGGAFTEFVCLRNGEGNYRANLLES